jgi:hypothetical protein
VALLDVNALVAPAWDSPVHHATIRRRFADNRAPSASTRREASSRLYGHLLTLARRRSTRVVTFDAGLFALAEGRDVELLTAL